jgi:alkylated DNA nucleotide flippase Atl1
MRVELPEELPALSADSGHAVADLIDRTIALGIGYDLSRLKPDLCMVAEVGEDESCFGDGTLSPEEFVAARRVELTPHGLAAFWEAHSPDVLTPAAAAAIALVEERYLPAHDDATSSPRVQAVLERIRAIPPGFVRTYGDVSPGAPRFAGSVLHDCGDSVPWHRVVRADGSLTKGARQRRLLEDEGVPFRGERVVMAIARLDPLDAA